MADKQDALDQAHQFLGNINPVPSAREHVKGGDGTEEETEANLDGQQKDDALKHSGARDVDEGGGVATEVGGTRNYHHTGGATGADLGNRPE